MSPVPGGISGQSSDEPVYLNAMILKSDGEIKLLGPGMTELFTDHDGDGRPDL